MADVVAGGVATARPDLGWILLGGMVGTGLRYAIDVGYPVAASAWPWPTFAVNIVGAFLLGALAAGVLRISHPDRRRQVKLFAGTGFCGAFTTYSAVALQLTTLADGGAPLVAVGYAAASLIAGIAAAWLGLRVGGVGDERTGGER